VIAAPGCTTTTTGTAGAITLPSMDKVPSRFTGVAPLAVFFDATGTTATATTRPFHDLEYQWGFGDVVGSPLFGASWGNGSGAGSSSRNKATGPVAAHVYETAGTYIVKLTVVDGTNAVSNSCVQIAVQNPDVVFAGANTVCIANSTATAGSGGCPAGAATPAGTAAFDTALAACIGQTKRCLFHTGDTFSSSALGTVASAGPITIGSYGTGALPKINSTQQGVLNINNAAVNDLRIMDLDIVGLATGAGICIAVSSTPSNILVLRLTCQDIGKGIIIGTGSNITGSVVQDSHIYNIYATSGGLGIFGWASNSAYLGNYVGPFDAGAEHLVRLEPGQKVAISNNTLTTPGTSGKAALTVRAYEHTPDAINPNTFSHPDTQYIYISDNKLIGFTSTPVFQIAPSSNNQNHWISDVISDRNWVVLGAGTQNGVVIEASSVTVRNGICDATGGATGRTCFAIVHTNTAGVPAPDRNSFFNDTCYSGDSASAFRCVWLGTGSTTTVVTNTTVKNVLAYAPLSSGTNPKVLTCGSTTLTCDAGSVSGTVVGGNSSDAQAKSTSPNWINASGLFNTPLDFKLPSSGSYAKGGGLSDGTVPVWSDFFLATEPATRDMGAVNH
jgi:hypothetical protein